jgi:hypothetical protein
MRHRWLLLFTCVPGVALGQGELPSNYIAVTESETYVRLELKRDGAATLISGVTAIDDDKGSEHKRRGKWRAHKDTVVVSFTGGRTITYKTEACLPHAEFGFEGCSFGLRPVNGSWDKSDLVMRENLWKEETVNPIIWDTSRMNEPPSDAKTKP